MKKSNANVRTDLAVECREMLHTEDTGAEIEGIKATVGLNSSQNIKVTTVEVLNETGAEQMGKPIGKYITIESEDMKINAVDSHEEIIKIMADELTALHELRRHDVVLVVGLGNWNVTPDALGPNAVSQLLVTRHIANTEDVPREITDAVRPVCAITPGVMGVTGIETAEIVKGVVEHVKPSLVIAVDALAARRTSRINSTIQMSNTGINPGAGLGNKRATLNEEALGVPVIGIGVPTVVDAATLVNDTMDRMLESMIDETPTGSEFYLMLKELEAEDKYRLITEMLDPYTGNMFVTPKEVDAIIERLANIIGNSINIAVHPGIGMEDINRFK
ncbi:MAG: GPR endopeptidase [Defluviitaleaceae bacterium]|nr:GPR endopeptidase [Defluviitaleaceae bacterium]